MIIDIVTYILPRLFGALAIAHVLTYGLSREQKDPVSHGRKVAAWVAASVVVTTPSMHRNGPDLVVFILINVLIWGGLAFVVGYLWRKFRPIKETIVSDAPVMSSPGAVTFPATSHHVAAAQTYTSDLSHPSVTSYETEKISSKAIQNTVASQSDEEFFAIALQELNSGNSVQGLWAKCFAEADGDENKTKARYLSARAGQLGAENIATIQLEAANVVRMRFLNAVEPEMVVLPKGQFLMGSGKDEGMDTETPQHTVQIDYALAVGKYPVTFDQWDACVKNGGTKYSPSDNGWGRGSRPVINVSWNDVQLYLRWLSNATGKTYRLLSEAEWEYAARAGSQTAYAFGDDPKELERYAWFSGNSGHTTHPVGEKQPNAWGLHDMHGNVREWTEDCWNDNYRGAPSDGRAWTLDNCSKRVVRGGSWYDDPQNFRAAVRSGGIAANRIYISGFRVARDN